MTASIQARREEHAGVVCVVLLFKNVHHLIGSYYSSGTVLNVDGFLEPRRDPNDEDFRCSIEPTSDVFPAKELDAQEGFLSGTTKELDMEAIRLLDDDMRLVMRSIARASSRSRRSIHISSISFSFSASRRIVDSFHSSLFSQTRSFCDFARPDGFCGMRFITSELVLFVIVLQSTLEKRTPAHSPRLGAPTVCATAFTA